LTGVYITDLAAWCQIDFYDSNSNPINYAKNLYLNEELVNNLIIPNEVTEIKPYAFYGAESIKTVTIHDGVNSVGNQAFSLCFYLSSITILSDTPPMFGIGVFNVTSAYLTIYVPASSVDAYKNPTNWSTYADKIQAIPTT
jgi:hypothetical protein